ncbi:hypothetical protein pb186bvf_019498 [Paramecium bursaria]
MEFFFKVIFAQQKIKYLLWLISYLIREYLSKQLGKINHPKEQQSIKSSFLMVRNNEISTSVRRLQLLYQLLEQKRLQYIQTSSFDPGNVESKIMKPLGKPPGKPINGSAKKAEKIRQKENKVIEIIEPNDVQPQQAEVIPQKPPPQQNQQQTRKESIQITRQFEEEVIKTKMNSLLAQEVEQVRKSVKLRSAAEDRIQKIQFIENKEIFKIIWSQRQDGLIPLPDYFDYESFKLNSPSLTLQFLEQIYFKSKNEYEIKYEYIGDQTKANQIIRSMINPIQEQNYETFQQLIANTFLNQDNQKQDLKLALKKQNSKTAIGSESKPIEINGEVQNHKVTEQRNDEQDNNDLAKNQVEQQPHITIQDELEKSPQEIEQNQQEQEKPTEEQDRKDSDENSENIHNNQDKEYLDLPDELFSQEEVRVPLNQDDY